MSKFLISFTILVWSLSSHSLQCVDALGSPKTSIGLYWDLTETMIAIENFKARENNNFRSMELKWMGFNEILKNARMSSEEVNFSYVKEDMNALYLGGQYLDLIDTPALTAIAWADQNQLAITSGSQAKALYELYRQGLISGEEMIPVVIQSMPIRGEGEPIQPRFPLASPSFFQTNSLGQRIPLTEPFPRIEP